MTIGACRSFEERLLARLDLEAGSPRPVLVDPHAAECSACAALLDEILGESALFRSLRRPESRELLARLRQAPPDFPARREASVVLDLLRPGALRQPEPSGELLGRLVFLPTRARSERRADAGEDARAAGVFGWLRTLFGDWRVTVAVAYALTLVFITVLKVDPLSVARETASDLTSAGERAIADARGAAAKRIGESSFAKAAQPLKSRLEYRVYRTVTAARARASAYSQLVFEKVFGATLEAESRPETPSPSRPREPAERTLRS